MQRRNEIIIHFISESIILVQVIIIHVGIETFVLIKPSPYGISHSYSNQMCEKWKKGLEKQDFDSFRAFIKRQPFTSFFHKERCDCITQEWSSMRPK